MANIVVYDPANSLVPNRVVGYYPSVNTPDYNSVPDKIINPDLSALGSVPQRHWKYDGISAVVEMSTAEKNAVDSYLDTYMVETISSGRLQKVEWFETDDGDGTYSGLARDDTYSWVGSSLRSVTSRRYYKDGTVVAGSVVVQSYYTTGDGKKVTKVTR